jgi:hypothetical protein
MGIKLVAFIVSLGALWDGFTTFRGVADVFDLASGQRINAIQFTFTLIVTLVILGFVVATHLIWSFKTEDPVTLLLKGAWVLCFIIDLYTSLIGTSYYVFNNEIDSSVKAIALIVVTFLISASSVLLSRILLAKDIRGKPFLF